MIRRPFFALLYGGIALLLPFCLRPVRFLFGNRVMKFLAGLSMNYYLAHQCIAVELKRLGLPPSVNALPNQAGEQPWQTQYTLLCFGCRCCWRCCSPTGWKSPAPRPWAVHSDIIKTGGNIP